MKLGITLTVLLGLVHNVVVGCLPDEDLHWNTILSLLVRLRKHAIQVFASLNCIG